MPLENRKVRANDEEKRDEHDHGQDSEMFPCWTLLLVLGYILAVFWFSVYMGQRLPDPIGYNDTVSSGPGVFIEERARGYLKGITDFGPRPWGSKNNKVSLKISYFPHFDLVFMTHANWLLTFFKIYFHSVNGNEAFCSHLK